jgi:hypothetical protein
MSLLLLFPATTGPTMTFVPWIGDTFYACGFPPIPPHQVLGRYLFDEGGALWTMRSCD